MFTNREGIKMFYLDDFSDRDLTAAVLKGEDLGSFNVASGYFPIESEAVISEKE